MRNVTLIESKAVSGGIDVVKNSDGGYNLVHNGHCEMRAYQIWEFCRGAGALIGFMTAATSFIDPKNKFSPWDFALTTVVASVSGALSGHMLGYGVSTLYESSCKGLN